MGGEKSSTTCSDVYMAVYTCDFCLKNYTEELLERCDSSGEGGKMSAPLTPSSGRAGN